MTDSGAGIDKPKRKRGRPVSLSERGKPYTIYCTPAEREAIRQLLASLRVKPPK